VTVALAAGLTLIALAVVVTLSRPPPELAGTNSIAPSRFVAETRGEDTLCQRGETVPSGTSAIRFWVNTNISPSVQVVVLSGSQVASEGRQQPGRLTGEIAVPVRPLRRTISGARVCFRFGATAERVLLVGDSTPHPRRGETPAKVRVEYLRAGHRSWWSLALSVARRIGLGRAPSGSWVALIPIVLMTGACLLTIGLLLRQLGGSRPRPLPPAAGADGATALSEVSELAAPPVIARRRPRAGPLRGVPTPAWACAAVACLSAASWSILTPPFQAPDEPSHFAYVQHLAEAGSLPSSQESDFSEEERAALADLHHQQVRFSPGTGTISSAAQQRRLESDLARPLGRQSNDAGVAASEPPLYYALEAIPYALGSSGSLLDRLALMRLLSALMAGLTVLFAFLFLREALPAVPWAWTVGALACALAPLVGFIAGTVNPDSLLCAVCAALFYCLARAFRRGLTRGLAIAIGVVLALGLLTKLNFLGLVPGVLVAVIVLARRAARTRGRAAYRWLALAVAIPAAPAGVYVAVNLLSNHAGLGLLSSGLRKTGGHGIAHELAYIWQFYLPRLPGMASYFPGVSTTRQIWFDRSVGVYGWLDTYFPNWVYELALIPAGALALLCARTLVASHAALRARAGELLSYALIGAGVMILVAADSFLVYPGGAGGYAEPRYLLPTAVLVAAALALAARGAGRRWGPVAGTMIVLLVLAHDVFSQLLVVGRFYG
jgi:Predicted membrane protein (DUF2142)